MLSVIKFIKGKALLITIIAILCVMGAAYLDAQQPTFLNDAINSIALKVRPNFDWKWGESGWKNHTENGDVWAFYPAIILMSIYAGSSLILGLGGAFLGTMAALLATSNTRIGIYHAVNTYSFHDVDKFSTASIITRMTNDAQKVQMMWQMVFTLLFRTPITIGISIYNAFTPPMGNVTYGCIVVGMIVLLLVVVAIIGTRVLPIFNKAQKQLDSTNVIMRENILGSRVIKAFNIDQNQAERYSVSNKELKRLNIRGQALLLPVMSVIQFILMSGIVIIIMVAGIQFVNYSDHPPIRAGIFAFTQLIAIVLFNTVIAIMVIIIAARTIPSARRIAEVVNTKPSIVFTQNKAELSGSNTLEFKNVSFKYNQSANSEALSNISFSLRSGETLGIIGGTGSGKSTIAHLIPRFYDIEKGEILIGGVNVKDFTYDQLYDTVGLVLQQPILLSGTIASNLLDGKQDATEEEMKEACKNACADSFIEQLPDKLNSIVEQRGSNFSGGQKQRLSLARTLIKNTPILILDDTTSALDLLTEANVQKNLSTNYNSATKIIISQRVSSVRKADNILVLDEGKVVGYGKHDELVQKCSIYNSIVESQINGGIK